MVLIIKVSIVGFCTYFAFFVFVEIISLKLSRCFWHHFYSFQILIYSSFVLGVLWGELFYFCKICTWLKLMGCLLITFFYTRHSFQGQMLANLWSTKVCGRNEFLFCEQPKGSMLVKNVVKHKNKIVTSDVDITVVLVVKVKFKKSSVKILQKRWQVKIF